MNVPVVYGLAVIATTMQAIFITYAVRSHVPSIALILSAIWVFEMFCCVMLIRSIRRFNRIWGRP